ncbi:MAG TPA: transposase, partial [Micromonospora sp.]|nr:transposase [Micromonospora sp.]
RRRRIETNPIRFRWDAAQPYDARMLSWQHDARTVSIWTVNGRLKGVDYTGSVDQFKAVAEQPIGESDLVHRDGMWFLYATVEVPEPEVYDPDGFLGVDMGIANIAYDSDGRRYVPLVEVDPRYTSQTCHGCGYRDKRNRLDQETFNCRSCGVVAHADHNAARNIAWRGVQGWGAVNRPHAA